MIDLKIFFRYLKGRCYRNQFLPCDSYAKRGICRRRVSVCVCVCVCVCHTPVLYQNG